MTGRSPEDMVIVRVKLPGGCHDRDVPVSVPVIKEGAMAREGAVVTR